MFVEFEATDIENMQPDKLNKRASEREQVRAKEREQRVLPSVQFRKNGWYN